VVGYENRQDIVFHAKNLPFVLSSAHQDMPAALAQERLYLDGFINLTMNDKRRVALDRFRQRCVKRRACVCSCALCAEGAGERGKIGAARFICFCKARAVVQALPLTYHAERFVVHNNDLDSRAIAYRSG